MRPLITVALIFSLAVNVAAAATIGYFWVKRSREPVIQSAGGPELTGEKRKEDWPRHLGMTPGQSRQFTDLMEEKKDNIRPLRQELMDKREKLFREIDGEAPDIARVDALITEISQLQAEIEKEVAHSMMRMKTILTPEQREKFFLEFHGKMKGHHTHHGMDRHK